MLFIILGAIVKPFADGQLDVIEEFHIRTFVDLVGVASGMIGNKKAERSTGVWIKWLAVQPVND